MERRRLFIGSVGGGAPSSFVATHGDEINLGIVPNFLNRESGEFPWRNHEVLVVVCGRENFERVFIVRDAAELDDFLCGVNRVRDEPKKFFMLSRERLEKGAKSLPL
jgi:hypothetical protein